MSKTKCKLFKAQYVGDSESAHSVIMPQRNPSLWWGSAAGAVRKTAGCSGQETHVLCQGMSLNRSQKTHPKSSDTDAQEREMLHSTSILWKKVFIHSYRSYSAPIINLQFLKAWHVFHSLKQPVSITQECPGYFDSELLKTERKEERNLHITVIQNRQMRKLK